jgi:hypothetical protein
MTEVDHSGYGRWQKLETPLKRVSYGATPHIHISARMREVLILFFQSEHPYRLYSQVANDTSREEDNAFDEDIKEIEAYFLNQRKASNV